MKSLQVLQSKYKISILAEAINEIYLTGISESLLTAQTAPASGVAVAPPAPVQQAAQPTPASVQPAPAPAPVQPAPAQQAAPVQPAPAAPVAPAQPEQSDQEIVKNTPKDQLPSLIDNAVANLAKTDPKGLEQLKVAVQKNDAAAVQQILAQHIQKQPVAAQPTMEEDMVSEYVQYLYENDDQEGLKTLKEYVESNGNLEVFKKNNPKFDETLVQVYETVLDILHDDAAVATAGAPPAQRQGGGFWAGLKNLWKRFTSSDFWKKHAPWAVLGALSTVMPAAAIVPLVAKAIGKLGKMDVHAGHGRDYYTKYLEPKPTNPTKVEPAKTEPAETEPAKTEPANTDPAQAPQAQSATIEWGEEEVNQKITDRLAKLMTYASQGRDTAPFTKEEIQQLKGIMNKEKWNTLAPELRQKVVQFESVQLKPSRFGSAANQILKELRRPTKLVPVEYIRRNS